MAFRKVRDELGIIERVDEDSFLAKHEVLFAENPKDEDGVGSELFVEFNKNVVASDDRALIAPGVDYVWTILVDDSAPPFIITITFIRFCKHPPLTFEQIAAAEKQAREWRDIFE